jgi:hypothetical protein
MRRSTGIVCLAAATAMLAGCDKPSIQQVFVTAAEDKPKIITADVIPTGNMEPGATVELVQLAPTQGPTGRVSMAQANMIGAQARFQGTVPIGGAPAMAYGTRWKATVNIPYSILFQSQQVSSSTEFIVGAAAGCASFDGDLEHESWPRSTQVRSNEADRPDVNAVVTHVPEENARPSVVTGALAIKVPSLPTRVGNEVWTTRFAAGGALTDWQSAKGMRVAVKSTDNVFVRAGLLVNRGVDEANPAQPVLQWIYTQNQPVDGGGWQVIELPFPAFPAPIAGNEQTTLSSFTVNFDTVMADMQVMIDDVCPKR